MQSAATTFRFEGFALDLRRGSLRGPHGEIDLRPKSFEVLRLLVENAGRLVPKEEIIEAVWPNVVVGDESLARCVSDVRTALADRRQRIIRTVPRRGYLFAVAVEASLATPGAEPAAPPERQTRDRRQLTVMACELVGFAALSRRLDPEELQAATMGCRQRCAAILGRHHGHLARFQEDGILAYFGYPQAGENDAEDAIRAGLALLDGAASLSPLRGAPVQTRIGIASGVVVVAEGIDPGRGTAVGEAPHLARQLQIAAQPGTLVVDRTTRLLVAGLFEYGELNPVVCDGYPNPVESWSVTGPGRSDTRFEARRIDGAATRPLRPAREDTGSGLSPFVGRAPELATLAGCLDRSSEICVIDIVGEPGIGKSRLLYEFRRRLAGSPARLWIGNCWPGDEQMPFRPFIEVVRRAFRLAAGDREAEIAEKFNAGLSPLGLATPENLGLLCNLLGLEPPAGSLRGLDDVLLGLRTRDLLLRLVRESGRAAPVVVVLEDLHWIDNASQDLLARLIATGEAPSVTIVHTRRPEYAPPWIGARNTTALRLEPLAASETSQIVGARLGASEGSGRLARMIAERAEGNPLFAEEIANFLGEEGIVGRRAGGLDYDAAAVAAALPASLQSLLAARVDRLLPADRALLQWAAVIGRRFAPDLLSAVGSGDDCGPQLSRLQDLDLVRQDSATGEFVFKHALVRDALYQSLLRAARQSLHLRIAREIERRNADRLGEAAEILAYHYSRADDAEKAIEYLALVGRKAIRIYSLDEGEHSLRTALDMLRSGRGAALDMRAARIMVDLAVVYYMQYRAADTIALIEPELDRIDALGDTVEAAILYDSYGVALFTSCRFIEAKQMAHRSLAIADRLGDPRSQAHARSGVMQMSVYVDPTPLAEFEEFARRAYAEAEAGEDTYPVVRMTMVIANTYMHRGLVREGRDYAFRLMRFGRERQDRRAEGMALWLLGWFDILSEDFPAALDHGEECIEIALAPYDRQWGRQVVGVSQLMLGRIAEGTQSLLSHRRDAAANGWPYSALLAEAPLAVALLLRGELRKGVRALEALAIRSEAEFGYRGYADWTRLFLAEFYVALLTGSRKPRLGVVARNLFFLTAAKLTAARKAEALLHRAAQNPQFSDVGVFRARVEFNLGLIRQAAGRRDLAQAHLARARDIARTQEAPAIVAKIEAALAALA